VKNKKNIFLFANVVLAVALFYLFFKGLDYAALGAILGRARFEWILAAAVLYYTLQFSTALRLKWLSDELVRPVGVLGVFKAHLAGLLFSDYTPGRAGYAYFVVRAREWGLKARQGVRVFGVSLASDFFTRGVFAALSIYYLFDSREALLACAALLVVGSLGFLWALTAPRKPIARLLALLPSTGAGEFYASVFKKRISSLLVYLNVGVSFTGAFVRGLEWMCLAAALGHPFAWSELFVFAAFNSVLTALSFVPLSVAGLGLQEGAGALFFSAALGVDLAFAGALMLLVRFTEAGCNLAGLAGLVAPSGKTKSTKITKKRS